MKPETRFAWVRLRASRYPSARQISKTARGCAIGRVTKAVKTAADLVHLPVSNARDIRLRLATVIFERAVTSYNQLQTNELWALDKWVLLGKIAVMELQEWLEAEYGEQLALESAADWQGQ